jgi:single-strand DNA-binding protein
MSQLNRAELIGNLGADPDLRHTSTGNAVVTLRVATNEFYRNKQGEQQKDTQWHRVVVWGAQAENCSKYLSKGRQVYVEGRLRTRQWEDTKGVTRTFTEIVARNVQFLGSPNNQDQESPPPADELPPEASPDETAQQIIDEVKKGDAEF